MFQVLFLGDEEGDVAPLRGGELGLVDALEAAPEADGSAARLAEQRGPQSVSQSVAKAPCSQQPSRPPTAPATNPLAGGYPLCPRRELACRRRGRGGAQGLPAVADVTLLPLWPSRRRAQWSSRGEDGWCSSRAAARTITHRYP